MSQQPTHSIYVLQLEKGNYYVGESQDPEKALLMHREGLGPVWTQIHKPIRIHAQYSDEHDVNYYVKQYMLDVGIDHVRGGSWEHLRLTDQDRIRIRNEGAEERGCQLM
jgi:hypothetical protein